MTDWIDISQPLSPQIAHWPGDTPFQYRLTASIEETKSVNIGNIHTSLHIGTHIDAPYHFSATGKTVDQLPIEPYIGRAVVIDVSHTKTINAQVLSAMDWPSNTKRILLHTSLENQPDRFPAKLPYLDPDIAPFLQAKGVHLLGVDMPSVDAPDSKDLATHHALAAHGIYILENVMLDTVPAGEYELIALPLPIQGADGSPVRAVIRPIRKGSMSNDR
ncbi:kynurenine formamidase [Virgibacillus pantothenticus]|uniref:Kynurenine formamidase n=1 Tax=Virgibacillus pantothenticus TaxID=1473 RepID=A0A0L0QKI6_VIRPA|nr:MULTISPECIES: arylformamidase [Virgibacillus]API91332.1 arylformamidase [Virgibacillus sp. 6R]KNE19097.1 kynurenine formamidase [Virgibacillus pantothenticus]MBS7426567.1 arylformamidase [Virgibacillus sp. 19R1-5]MBU8567248.1 arylformamidase [Virgibacillus pantothenticus]MBU8600004.1 arylformamidase [Virgibacillus pantothenticus]